MIIILTDNDYQSQLCRT